MTGPANVSRASGSRPRTMAKASNISGMFLYFVQAPKNSPLGGAADGGGMSVGPSTDV